jgi:hypothetical protein
MKWVLGQSPKLSQRKNSPPKFEVSGKNKLEINFHDHTFIFLTD